MRDCHRWYAPGPEVRIVWYGLRSLVHFCVPPGVVRAGATCFRRRLWVVGRAATGWVGSIMTIDGDEHEYMDIGSEQPDATNSTASTLMNDEEVEGTRHEGSTNEDDLDKKGEEHYKRYLMTTLVRRLRRDMENHWVNFFELFGYMVDYLGLRVKSKPEPPRRAAFCLADGA